MPLVFSVATTEYSSAVNRAPGLAVGAEREPSSDDRASERPFRGIIVHGDLGLVDEDAQPAAMG